MPQNIGAYQSELLAQLYDLLIIYVSLRNIVSGTELAKVYRFLHMPMTTASESRQHNNQSVFTNSLLGKGVTDIMAKFFLSVLALTVIVTFSVGTFVRAQEAAPVAPPAPSTPAATAPAPAEAEKKMDGEKEKKGKKGKKSGKGKKKDKKNG
jgi:hypothetical protein